MAEWIMWLRGAGLMTAMAALVLLAWWALFGDRARGRRRCPACWYDLSGAPALTCAECGHTAASEAELRRTRRRRGLALLAILGCASIGAYVIDAANTRGWPTYVPTRALVVLTPWLDSAAASNEVARRVVQDDLPVDQLLWILERATAGGGDHRPPSDGWERHFASIVQAASTQLLRRAEAKDRAEADGLEDEAAEVLRQRVNDLVLALPPRVDLRTPASWPAGVPVTVDVYARDWWPGGTQMRIVAEPDVEGAVPDAHVRLRGAIQPRSYSLRLPALGPGLHEIPVRLSFDRRGAADEPWTPVGSRTDVLTVQVAPRRDLPGASSEEMNQAIAETFSRGLIWWPSGSLPVRVGVNILSTMTTAFDDTAIAVRLDILRNGQRARQLDIWWRGGDQTAAWEVPMLDDSVLAPPPNAEDRWQIRVTGRPDLALRVPGAVRYWEGEVLVDVTCTPARAGRRRAPSRGWIPESDPMAQQAIAEEG